MSSGIPRFPNVILDSPSPPPGRQLQPGQIQTDSLPHTLSPLVTSLVTHTLPRQGPENKDDKLCFCIPNTLWLPFPRQADHAKGFPLSRSHYCLSFVLAQLLAGRDPGNPTSSQPLPRSRSCPTSGCKFPPCTEAPLHINCVVNGSCCSSIPKP